MKAYKEIRANIARLEREAEAARKAESVGAVAKIRKLAAEYDLTAADIGLDGARHEENSGGSGRTAVKVAPKKAARKATAKKTARSGAGVAKYRDPKSGQTWSGFGRAPQWLATAKKRDVFLIVPSDAQAEVGAPAEERSEAAVTKSHPPSKAARKASAKAAARKAVPAGKAARRPVAKKRVAGTVDAGELPVFM